MKNLYIIRHAKSSWKETSLDDFDRPLNKRGKRDAPLMGNLLKEQGVAPDLIISSPAKRAKDTAKIIAKHVNYKKDILFEQNIYEAGIYDIDNVVTNIDDNNKTVFLFGHNPALNEYVYQMVELYDNVPTAGIVHLRFNVDRWSDLCSECCELINFDFPKKHI